ncbi:unnamed protein product [Darwinula stevensoni]|uniref:Ubiquitin carboxyl-terminal hydrolase n=1 Tax=Darwinula stevensoni TaxID=69355 RepID=A0A7R8XEB8_9CRUS|nr:unnamed protein product [Darwinula stevensoni]CAG0889434.1 unnamed protein product [Darwinula stevensoni]
MECPHVEECVKITELTPPEVDKISGLPIWRCTEEGCGRLDGPWVCGRCGVVRCGRYVHGHMKLHWEQFREHTVCLDPLNMSAYCYICDEFVMNDTRRRRLEQLRDCLIRLNGHENSDQESHNESKGILPEEDNDKCIHLRARRHRPNRSMGMENHEEGTSQKRRKFERVPADGKQGKRVVGLQNLGNTCFMNVVLQSLSNIKEFSGYFKQLPSLEKGGNSRSNSPCPVQVPDKGEVGLMAEELRKVLISLKEGGKSAISPESLFTVIWRVVPRFRFLSPVRCLVCKSLSEKHDPFLDLSLDIPDRFVEARPSKGKEDDSPQPPLCNLYDCLKNFTDVEELEDSELYHCNFCKDRQRSTKKFSIRRLPNVLCLHLKRFRWHAATQQRLKVNTPVQFPVFALDMSDFVQTGMHRTRHSRLGSTLYDLAAVIVHHGSGAGSGHYTAFAVNEGRWYHFNDRVVRVSDESTVAKCRPYILFYIRREFRLPRVSDAGK